MKRLHACAALLFRFVCGGLCARVSPARVLRLPAHVQILDMVKIKQECLKSGADSVANFGKTRCRLADDVLSSVVAEARGD